MLKTLVRARLSALGAMMLRSQSRRGSSKGMKVLFVILFLYLGAVLTFSVGAMSVMIGKALIPMGLGWLFLAVVGMMAVSLCFVGTVFLAQSQIFQSRDNELLLSMPVPSRAIVLSRMLAMLALNYIYTAVIMVPAGAVYAYLAHPAWSFYLWYVIGLLLLPLLSLTLTCVFGYVLGSITSRVRNKTLISMVGMLIFFGAYMYASLNLTNYASALIQNGAAIGDAIRRALPPFYAFGTAAATGDLWQGILLALWCCVPFAAVTWLIVRGFRAIAIRKQGAPKLAYKAGTLRVSSIYGALLRKEMRRFFGTPMYAVNCGFGALLALGLAGYTAFKGPAVLAEIGAAYGMGDMIVPILAVMLAFLSVMDCSTAPSISLEGTNLWILKAHPVPIWSVFWAKISLNMIVNLVPMVVVLPLFAFALDLSAMQVLLLFGVVAVFSAFTALFGLSANLLFPRLDWLNETTVIKQSVSTMIAVFGGMAAVAAPAILYALVLSSHMGLELFIALVLVFYVLVSAALVWFLNGKGRRIFAGL